MMPRAQTPSRLLARIRRLDYEGHSDAELRLAFRKLQFRAPDSHPDSLMPECFAIIAEAIDRRLGVWRFFDNPAPSSEVANVPGEGSGVFAESSAEVARLRTHRRQGDILLSSEIYRAVRRSENGKLLRFQPTDEQLLAGMHLYRGKVVQMEAGEGKTVAIAFAAALHAVLGRRVHVITANDYLADRDATVLQPVYESLGLSVGSVLGQMEDADRRQVYRRSIVYGPMRELGFDFLRDNLKTSSDGLVQQELDVAVVDEADHALIDEAFTPLIISGNPIGGTRTAIRVNLAVVDMIGMQRQEAEALAGSLDSSETKPAEIRAVAATLLLADPDNATLLECLKTKPRLHRRARMLAEDDYAALGAGLYYAFHPGIRLVTLTGKGREFLERRLPMLGIEVTAKSDGAWLDRKVEPHRKRHSRTHVHRQARRYAVENQVSQALTAHLILKRDIDYLVDDDGIVLIDPHTGRPKPDSIYQHGLQSAVEAKEGAQVRPENETLAQVSVGGYVSRYRSLAGITGTAAPASSEFRRKYGLGVEVVPPASSSKRTTRPPKVYLDREDKLAAIVDEIAARHRLAQPVLVGTRTVEQSEELGRMLEEREIPHTVLNAVTTHSEARIVRDAGAYGAVTIATHMAGRGTDILLEADLNGRMVRQCAVEVHRLLTDEASTVVAVQVRFPGPEQAEILHEELDRYEVLTVEPVSSGEVLHVALGEWKGHPSDSVGLDYALGLCVVGTEVHDSSRITLQLNGRSGRQGQFGLVQSVVSLEDRLVNLDAEAILKLSSCLKTDSAGRAYYSGPEATRRIESLQDAAEREGEAQRALMQDYAAELDRQTQLYYQRRQQVMELGSDPDRVWGMCREVTGRVAVRLVAAYLGRELDDDYTQRFQGLAEEAWRDYRVECSELSGLDLSLVPAQMTRLLADRVEQQARGVRRGVFPELARLLYLQVCGDLWPAHITLLRDSIASQLLSGNNHKSAVAQYIRRGAEAWQVFWMGVEAEFLSRLATLPLAEPEMASTTSVAVSGETVLLVSLLSGDAGSAVGGEDSRE